MGKATVIPFGPQHPVLPEPLHLDLVVDDETVIEAVALETDLSVRSFNCLKRAGNMQQLAQIITRHPGFCEVRLAVLDAKGNAQVMTFGDRFRVKRDTSLFAEIKSLFGPSCLPTA